MQATSQVTKQIAVVFGQLLGCYLLRSKGWFFYRNILTHLHDESFVLLQYPLKWLQKKNLVGPNVL
jgi:hypothetical protein